MREAAYWFTKVKEAITDTKNTVKMIVLQGKMYLSKCTYMIKCKHCIGLPFYTVIEFIVASML